MKNRDVGKESNFRFFRSVKTLTFESVIFRIIIIDIAELKKSLPFNFAIHLEILNLFIIIHQKGKQTYGPRSGPLHPSLGHSDFVSFSRSISPLGIVEALLPFHVAGVGIN